MITGANVAFLLMPYSLVTHQGSVDQESLHEWYCMNRVEILLRSAFGSISPSQSLISIWYRVLFSARQDPLLTQSRSIVDVDNEEEREDIQIARCW